MKLDEIGEMLKEAKIPVAYSHFAKTQPPPFLVYYDEEEQVITADSVVIYKVLSIAVELYTTTKNETIEEKIENLLSDHRLGFSKFASWINDAKVYQTIYEFDTEVFF